jgi:acyl-CoA dehydrogenase family protein 9
MTILNYGRLGLGAASVGAMEQSLDDMFKRATSRKQFGVPVREFELIQEKMAVARAHGLAAEAMTSVTASLLEKDPTGAMAIESSHVKLYGTTRAWGTLDDALQTAGGSGYLATQPYEKRLRDFRVTTVFEGTSEIHTMYPALYLLRTLGKRLKGKSRLAQAVYLVRAAYRNPGLSFDHRDPSMARAAGLAATLTRKVRRMVHLGLLRHGKGLVSRQFFLRRVTHLSLAAYQLISALLWAQARQKEGHEITAELNLLNYLSAEAAETLRTSDTIPDTPKEIAGQAVFKDILAMKEPVNETPAERGGEEDNASE